jgi:hypothetical protein
MCEARKAHVAPSGGRAPERGRRQGLGNHVPPDQCNLPPERQTRVYNKAEEGVVGEEPKPVLEPSPRGTELCFSDTLAFIESQLALRLLIRCDAHVTLGSLLPWFLFEE